LHNTQNCKRFGNVKPEILQGLENDVWVQVLDVAQGKLSAIRAVNNLRDAWSAPSSTEIPALDNTFYKRGRFRDK
jgi:hypothetical protein